MCIRSSAHDLEWEYILDRRLSRAEECIEIQQSLEDCTEESNTEVSGQDDCTLKTLFQIAEFGYGICLTNAISRHRCWWTWTIVSISGDLKRRRLVYMVDALQMGKTMMMSQNVGMHFVVMQQEILRIRTVEHCNITVGTMWRI